jgi:hypothetical protein
MQDAAGIDLGGKGGRRLCYSGQCAATQQDSIAPAPPRLHPLPPPLPAGRRGISHRIYRLHCNALPSQRSDQILWQAARPAAAPD